MEGGRGGGGGGLRPPCTIQMSLSVLNFRLTNIQCRGHRRCFGCRLKIELLDLKKTIPVKDPLLVVWPVYVNIEIKRHPYF